MVVAIKYLEEHFCMKMTLPIIEKRFVKVAVVVIMMNTIFSDNRGCESYIDANVTCRRMN